MQLDASVAAPYWPQPQASHPPPNARLVWPDGQMHLGSLLAPVGTMPETQTHWLALEAPVPLVVRPDGHGLHVAWFATPAYLPSAHATQLLPTSRYPSGQEHLSKWPTPPLPEPSFTIAGSVQLQLATPIEP